MKVMQLLGSVTVNMLINRVNINNVKGCFAAILNIKTNILPLTLGFYLFHKKIMLLFISF
jgi:hypothetical protein